jgi:uncharacterized protein with NAD-binding domain and iron-sulfur cluster
MVFEYRGSIFWKMQGGMGDVVFAPLYYVLEARGVSFEFFHRVRKLRLDEAQEEIAAIEIDRQVWVKPDTFAGASFGGPSEVRPARPSGGVRAPGSATAPGEYYPLYAVKGLLSWPSEPLYEQIVDGDKLRKGWHSQHFDLESHWSAWKPVEKRVLKKGADFDVVVLGIAVGALPYICEELIAARPAWQAMIEHVTTVQTQCMQLWMRPSLENLGWSGASSVVAAYQQPMNTYADMTHLINRESWPVGTSEHPNRGYPGSLAYFCGPMKDTDLLGPPPPELAPGDAGTGATFRSAPAAEQESEIARRARRRDGLPPPSARGFHAWAKAQTKEESFRWLRAHAGVLWPRATLTTNPDELDWNFLVDPDDRWGVERYDAQYWRANVDPSERYVMSAKGSIRHRLRSGESGFDNLVLAGDWTRNGVNTGCVEAAAMSGMQAARAICGRPANIVGESDALGQSPRRGPVKVVGDYAGSVIILFLPTGEVEATLPSDLELAEQHFAPPGMHPVVLALGERRGVHMTFPRSLFERTYLEVMNVIPYVRPRGVLRVLGGRGPFGYVPRCYVDDTVMAGGGLLFWGLDTELASIVSAWNRRDRTEGYWIARTYLRHEPLVSIASRAHDAYHRAADYSDTMRFAKGTMGDTPELEARLRTARVNIEGAREMLAQPLLTRSARGLGPYAALHLDWGLDRGKIRPMEADVHLYDESVHGAAVGDHVVQPFGQAEGASFGFRMRTRFQMSLPMPPKWAGDRQADEADHRGRRRRRW